MKMKVCCLIMLLMYALIVSSKKIQTKGLGEMMDNSWQNLEIQDANTNKSINLNFEYFKKVTIIFSTLFLLLLSLICLFFPTTNTLIMKIVYMYIFVFLFALFIFSRYPDILNFFISIAKVLFLLGLFVFLLVFLV